MVDNFERKAKKTYLECKNQNILNYRLEDFIKHDKLESFFFAPANQLGIELLLTARHGEEFLATPKYKGRIVNVVEQPGDKIRILERTLGHLYVDFDGVESEKLALAKKWYVAMYENLVDFLTASYIQREAEDFIIQNQTDAHEEKKWGKIDSVTGVLTKPYFYSKLKLVERAEISPVALIQGNVNDTKYFYDTYGEEEGNRLLEIIAGIIKDEGKDEYIIGRTGVDSFQILIPLVEEGEAEAFCKAVQKKADEYEDELLAPSIAMGIIIRVNIEETFDERMSDVEFEMLSNKMKIKKKEGYEKRKEKGQK